MKHTLFLFLLAILGFSAYAQEKGLQAYSLKQAVDYALQNNYNIKNAKLSEKSAKAKNWEILTTGMPQVNGSLDYSYYFKVPQVPALSQAFGDPNNPFVKAIAKLDSVAPGLKDILAGGGTNNISFVLPNTLSTGVQVSQLIFDARYLIGVKATKDLLITSRFSRELSEQDIRYNVTKAYYQAEAAQEGKALLQDNMKIIDKLLEDTRKTFQQGLIEELDVNRLELAKSTLESQINMQNRLGDVALANLKYQMGMSLSDQILLTDKLDALKASAGIALESKFEPSMRIEYSLLSTAIKLKGYDMARYRSGYSPTVAAFLNYTGNVQTEKFSEMFKPGTGYRQDGSTYNLSRWYPQGIVGLSIKIPIFDSGLKAAQVRQAKLELQKTQNEFENFKSASQLQFEVAQSTLNSAIADEAISTKTIELSKKIFDRNETKFKAGVASSFELQQSQQEYATNQLKYIQSVVSLLNAKADLDKAMGVK